MREVNLLIVYLLKTAEVLVLFFMTYLIFAASGSLLTLKIENVGVADTNNFGTSDQGKSLRTKIIICGILAIIHTVHNNFLTNLRISLSQSKANAIFCWKPINYCICKFGTGDEMNGLQFICRDRCCKVPTVLKTIVYWVVFIIVGNDVQS